MSVFDRPKPRPVPDRPVPRCCGYCQSPEIKPHCANCSWVTCKKCYASSTYTRACAPDHPLNGRTWRLIFTKGVASV